MPQLSIIIVNYNVRHYLHQCLQSIWQQKDIDLAQIEVFVVDNASSDHSVNYIKAKFPSASYPQLRLVSNRRNVGFGRANNQALAKAKGEYILFLNPDTILPEHTLARTLAFANKQSDFGAIGAKMLNNNGGFALESRRGLPTPWVSLCKMSGLVKLFPRSRRFGKYYLGHLSREVAAPIDIISGAFMMTRKSVLNQVGAFDEDFFMYGEDIDLSYRLIKSGRHNYYFPTPILHYKGESAHKSSYRYVHVFYEAMLIFFNKHFRHYGPFLSIPIKLAILLQAIVSLLAKNAKNFRKYFFPHGNNKQLRMLYLGTHHEDMETISELYSQPIDCVEATELTLPEGHLSETVNASNYDIIVYDTEDFSFESILHPFSQSPCRLKVGTYHPIVGTLITDREIYTLENE